MKLITRPPYNNWTKMSFTQRKVNNIHERELLNKDNSFTVHERNIQALGIELYKVANGLSPGYNAVSFPSVFPSENMFITRNVKSVRHGTETLAHLGPKMWSIIPSDIKKEQSLKLFTKKNKTMEA